MSTTVRLPTWPTLTRPSTQMARRLASMRGCLDATWAGSCNVVPQKDWDLDECLVSVETTAPPTSGPQMGIRLSAQADAATPHTDAPHPRPRIHATHPDPRLWWHHRPKTPGVWRCGVVVGWHSCIGNYKAASAGCCTR